MRYRYRVTIRLILALFFVILGLKLVDLVISPITFYLSYLSLFYLSPVLMDSTSFVIQDVTLRFISACTAGPAYLLLLLLVLFVDLKWKKIIKVFLIGVLLILVANLIRIDILIISLIKYDSTLFNTLHLFFWKVLSTVYVFLLWILLTWWFKIKEIPIYSDIKRFHWHHKESWRKHREKKH